MSVSQNFENSQLKQQLLLEMWKKKNSNSITIQVLYKIYFPSYLTTVQIAAVSYER